MKCATCYGDGLIESAQRTVKDALAKSTQRITLIVGAGVLLLLLAEMNKKQVARVRARA